MPKTNNINHRLHIRLAQAFLVALLVGSDLFIGMIGHYSGTTGDIWSFESFVNYLMIADKSSLLIIFLIAIVVVITTEFIVKKSKLDVS